VRRLLAFVLVVLAVSTASADAAAPGVNGDVLFAWSQFNQVTQQYDRGMATLAPSPLVTGYTPSALDVRSYAWSPDGTRLAYSDNLNLWVVNADGSSPQRITDMANPPAGMSPASAQEPDWAPDGQSIVFDNQRALWTVPADGSSQPTLLFSFAGTSFQPEAQSPTYSPDGERIAFSSIGPNNPDPSPHMRIWTINVAAPHEPTQITHPGPDPGPFDWIIDGSPDWSPDGTRVAFGRFTNGVRSDVWVVAPGGLETNLTSGLRGGSEPSWAPDGSEIAFSTGNNIGAVAPDGTNPHLYLDFGTFTDAGALDWQPLRGPNPDFRIYASASKVVDPGDPITYRVTLSNMGSDPLVISALSVDVCDGLVIAAGSDANQNAAFDPGEVWRASCSRTATSADAGTLAGTASATAAPSGGGVDVVRTAAVSTFVRTPPELSALTVSAPSAVHPGDPVQYDASLENTGLIAVAPTSFSAPYCDASPVVSGDDGNDSIDPGETWHWTCSHVAGSADADQIQATATFGGATTEGSTISRSVGADTSVLRPQLAVSIAGATTARHGDTVLLTYTVQNTGNTPLGSLVVNADTCFGVPELLSGASPLAPGSSATYGCTVVFPDAHVAVEPDPLLNHMGASGEDALGAAVADTAVHAIDLAHTVAATSEPATAGTPVGANTEPTPGAPIGAAVTLPAAGTVSITAYDGATTEPPGGASYSLLGYEVVIDASDVGTLAAPLEIAFVLDSSIDVSSLIVLRDGVEITAGCAATLPIPGPCIKSVTTTTSGDTLVSLLTDHASTWNFASVATGAPPAISITRPAEGDRYLLGRTVTAAFGCTSFTAPLASCVGTVPHGAAIPTGASALGSRTFTVDASSQAGSTSAIRNYKVALDFGGFRAPVAARPALNTVRAGTTVPVSFALRDAAGASVFSVLALNVQQPGSPRMRGFDCKNGTQAATKAWVSAGGTLTYDARAKAYVYSWATNKAWAGECRRLQFTLRDGDNYAADFKLAK
jgi:uncharacterized repeat protein (TIGR01451 family)